MFTNWMKKQLGVDAMEQNLQRLNSEKETVEKRLKETHDQLVALRERESQKDKEKQAIEQELKGVQSQLQMFREREEADKAKYESKEPWVEIRSAEFNESRGIQISLDWNEAFVEYLKEGGIKGSNDEEVVQKWLAMLYQHLVAKLEAAAINRKDQEKGVSDYV